MHSCGPPFTILKAPRSKSDVLWGLEQTLLIVGRLFAKTGKQVYQRDFVSDFNHNPFSDVLCGAEKNGPELHNPSTGLQRYV